MLFHTLELLIEPPGADAHPAAVNMALDEALLTGASGKNGPSFSLPALKHPLLRVYSWRRPAVTFGYFERWEPIAAAFPRHDLVRRWTGGGVVQHGHDWTYSLIVPTSEPFAHIPTGESYRRVHSALAEALCSVGIPVYLASTATPKQSQACFANPVAHDLLVWDAEVPNTMAKKGQAAEDHPGVSGRGQKIAGAAQRRCRLGLLHQGSVQGGPLLDFDLKEHLLSHLPHALAGRLSGNVLPRALLPDELKAAEELARTRYATEAWNRKF